MSGESVYIICIRERIIWICFVLELLGFVLLFVFWGFFFFLGGGGVGRTCLPG